MSGDVIVRFAPNQKLPPDYAVIWCESDEMYRWMRSDGTEGPEACCRYMARRMAWANYERALRRPDRARVAQVVEECNER